MRRQYYLSALIKRYKAEIEKDLKNYYKKNKEYLKNEWETESYHDFYEKFFKPWKDDPTTDFDCEIVNEKQNTIWEIEHLERRSSMLEHLEKSMTFIKGFFS